MKGRGGFLLRKQPNFLCSTSGGHFGQNGLTLHENYKIMIIGAKHWGTGKGEKPIVRAVGRSPQSRGSSSLEETL